MNSTPSQAAEVEECPLRILCADDDDNIRRAMQAALERRGHWVECVGSGEEGLARIGTGPADFDLLITDQDMSGMRGIDLVEELRRRDIRIPVIVHSSRLREWETAAFRAAGVAAIIEKPIALDYFIRVVEQTREGKERGK